MIHIILWELKIKLIVIDLPKNWSSFVVNVVNLQHQIIPGQPVTDLLKNIQDIKDISKHAWMICKSRWGVEIYYLNVRKFQNDQAYEETYITTPTFREIWPWDVLSFA